MLVRAIVDYGQLDVVKALVRYGASIEYTSSVGTSLLAWACSGSDKPGKMDIEEYLLMLGTKVNVQDTSGYTALIMAAQSGNVESV